MGIYFRFTASLLIAALSLPAFSAVRQSYNPSAKSVVDNYISADFQTPSGIIHYIGAEKYYALDTSLNARPGDRVAPTIRPVTSSVGTPSFPYGQGAMYGTADGVIGVKPVKNIPSSAIAGKVKDIFRATPGAVAVSLAMMAVVETAGWAIDELTGQITREGQSPSDAPGNYVWLAPLISDSPPFPSPLAACEYSVLSVDYLVDVVSVSTHGGNGNGFCSFRRSDGTHTTFTSPRLGSGCSSGQYSIVDGVGACYESSSVPVTSSDIDNLQITGTTDFYTDLMRDACGASSNPDGCYDSLVESSSLTGPATVSGGSTSSTTTSLNPDGTTTTTTTTRRVDHDVSYGPGHFDVGTKITETTEVNGEQTSQTVIEDTSTPSEDTPEQEQEEQYTFEDTDLPEVEPFYEPQYPDGLSGVWDSFSADVQSTAFMEFLGSFVPQFAGSCPSFNINLSIASWASYGSMDFPSLCYIFDFIKIIMLATAVFTARALIFGG